MRYSGAIFLLGILAFTSCGFGEEEPTPPAQTAQIPQMPPAASPSNQPASPEPAQAQPGNNQGGQQTIQLPGLGTLPLPIPQGQSGKQGGSSPQGNGNTQTIQIPGMPGLKLPIALPSGGGNTGGPSPTRREAPGRGTLAAAPPGSFNAYGNLDSNFVQNRTQIIHQTIVSALQEPEKSQTQAVPFRIVNEIREPNAAAGCTKSSNQAVMLITSAMVNLAAGISVTKAYDEVAQTKTLDTYVNEVIRQVRSKQPIGMPSPSLFLRAHALDQHKLARQIHLFDQQVAFIIGHELAHHYRGHTGCIRGRTAKQVQVDDVTRILAHKVPLFSQPREVEADMWAMVNILEAGAQRSGGSWNEEGALLNLDFFGRLRQRGGSDLVMLFLSTHPAPQLRVPIVQTTARQWRPGWRPMTSPGASGSDGRGINLPTPAGNIELPIPIPTQSGG